MVVIRYIDKMKSNILSKAIILIGLLFSSLMVNGCGEQETHKPGIRLYVLDGGRIDVADMWLFCDEGRLAGEKIQLVNPAFLIRHPQGDLLWDTGNGDALADKAAGNRFGIWHYYMKRKVIDQLAQLDLTAADIDFLALSHLHPDHSGNANLFSAATFIVNEREQAYMFSDSMQALFGESYHKLAAAKTILFQNEYDVFGDSTVIITTLPGHTPGSAVLLLRLAKAGNLLLSGDLYIHNRARTLQTIPVFTQNKAAILDSSRKFEALAAKEKARVIIQHSKIDFEALPMFPAYLD